MKKILAMAAVALALGMSSLVAANAEAIKVGFSPEAYPPFYSPTPPATGPAGRSISSMRSAPRPSSNAR